MLQRLQVQRQQTFKLRPIHPTDEVLELLPTCRPSAHDRAIEPGVILAQVLGEPISDDASTPLQSAMRFSSIVLMVGPPAVR
jgi:hypothetical protein